MKAMVKFYASDASTAIKSWDLSRRKKLAVEEVAVAAQEAAVVEMGKRLP